LKNFELENFKNLFEVENPFIHFYIVFSRCSSDHPSFFSADRDECSEWGFCEQLCENTDGWYTCHCAPGYILHGHNKCRAQNISALELLLAQDRAIWRLSATGEDRRIIANTTGASGVDYLYSRNLLFWSDMKTRKVHSESLGINLGSEVEPAKVDISMAGSWGPISIAVDWIGDKLYVADSIVQKVDVFELDGRYHGIVVGSNLTSPTDIALDPTRGLMFIADSKQVLRTNMDGTNAFPVVSEAAYKVSGVAVDIIAKRIFWCDSLLDYIETADYRGHNRVMILRGSQVPSAIRLTLFENRIFWTDGTKQAVMSIDKTQGDYSIQNVFKVRIRNQNQVFQFRLKYLCFSNGTETKVNLDFYSSLAN